MKQSLVAALVNALLITVCVLGGLAAYYLTRQAYGEPGTQFVVEPHTVQSERHTTWVG